MVGTEYITDTTHANTVSPTHTNTCIVCTYVDDDGTSLSITSTGFQNRSYEGDADSGSYVFDEPEEVKETPKVWDKNPPQRRSTGRIPKIVSPPGGWFFFKG